MQAQILRSAVMPRRAFFRVAGAGLLGAGTLGLSPKSSHADDGSGRCYKSEGCIERGISPDQAKSGLTILGIFAAVAVLYKITDYIKTRISERPPETDTGKSNSD